MVLFGAGHISLKAWLLIQGPELVMYRRSFDLEVFWFISELGIKMGALAVAIKPVDAREIRGSCTLKVILGQLLLNIEALILLQRCFIINFDGNKLLSWFLEFAIAELPHCISHIFNLL